MSGTGQFRPVRGARTGAFSVLAREHLGDRLAAFVDGELGGDARDRVLSHLASCDPCKAEAEEQRRLKSAVAGALPPALSAGLLARLQGLPGCDHDDLSGPGPDTPLGLFGRAGPGLPGGRPGDDPRGGDRSFLTPGPHGGFPIHEFGRSASRGRRLAFVAAGAFSLAALAIGAALPLEGTAAAGGATDPAPGSAATPLSMRQVADQHAAAGVSPAPHTAAERALPDTRAPRPAPAAAVRVPAVTPGAGTPGPSALPPAPWTSPTPSASAPASPSPSATPPTAPVAAGPRAPAPSVSAPVAGTDRLVPETLPMTAGHASRPS